MPRQSARERILEASMALFSERGYRNTTTKMIADAASVNEVTLFRQFGTKEGIVKAIVQSRSFVLTEFQQALGDAATGDLYADLLKAARVQYKHVAANLKLVVTLAQENVGDCNVTAFVSALPRGIKEILIAYFTRMQAAGKMKPVSPELAAVTFMTPTFGMTFMKGFFGDMVTTLSPDAHLELTVRNFVDGVQT